MIPKNNGAMIASIILTIFAQPDAEYVNTQFNDARHDILALANFSQRHWKKIWSTNPLERVNKEIKRRTDVLRQRRAG